MQPLVYLAYNHVVLILQLHRLQNKEQSYPYAKLEPETAEFLGLYWNVLHVRSGYASHQLQCYKSDERYHRQGMQPEIIFNQGRNQRQRHGYEQQIRPEYRRSKIRNSIKSKIFDHSFTQIR